MASGESLELQREKTLLVKELEQMRGELQNQIAQRSELIIYKEKYEDLALDYNDINKEYDALIKKEAASSAELRLLRKEIEELSSELFKEANRMVSQERKKNHKLHDMNKCMKNEINEQKVIIKMYEHQLESLKDAVWGLENENKGLKSKIEHLPGRHSPLVNITTNQEENLDYIPEVFHDDINNKKLLANILHTPSIQALRYDLKFYSSFIEYVYANQLLLRTKSQPDYKDAYFFKRLVVEDIDPTLNLESSPILSFFQKKAVYNSIFNLAVRIEPFTNINEKQIKKATMKNSIILMSKKCCSVCGEDRNDTLEHARLYSMKTLPNKRASPSLTSRMFMNNVETTAGANADFPLCTFCLSRVRSVCDLFGFLNTVKQGMYMVDKENKSSCKRLYLELTRHRSKLFWSRVGVVQAESFFVENTSFSEKQLNFQYEFNLLNLTPEIPSRAVSRIGSPLVNNLASRFSSPAMSSDSSLSPNLESPFSNTASYVSSVTCSPMSVNNLKPCINMSPFSSSVVSDSDSSDVMNDFTFVSAGRNINASSLIFERNIPGQTMTNTEQLQSPVYIEKQQPNRMEEQKWSLTKAEEAAKVELPKSPELSESKIAEQLIAQVSPRFSKLSPKESPVVPDVKSVLSEQEDQVDLDSLASVLDQESYDDKRKVKSIFEPIAKSYETREAEKIVENTKEAVSVDSLAATELKSEDIKLKKTKAGEIHFSEIAL